MTAQGGQAHPPVTPTAQEALDRVVSIFPGAKPGPREPHSPSSRQLYERLLSEQSRLAAVSDEGLTLLQGANPTLAEAEDVDGLRLVPVDFSTLLEEGI